MRIAIGCPGAAQAEVFLNGTTQTGVQLADTDAGYICKYLPGNPSLYSKNDLGWLAINPPPKKMNFPKFVHLRGFVQVKFLTPQDTKLSNVLEEYYSTSPSLAEDFISPYGDITCYACGELIDKTI